MLVLMKRIVGLGVAWLGATVLSVLIASTAVAGIRARVVETPEAIGAPTTTTTITVASTGDVPSTTLPAATSTSSTLSTSTTQPPETTTTVAESQTTTTTTAPPATTTTTTAPPVMQRKTFALIGGTVVVEYGGNEVRVISAVPNSGYYPHIENKGPDEIQVEFEGNEHKSELVAHMEGGQLKYDVKDESHDGGDDGGEHDD
jgi:hypothetical protein